MGAAQSVVVDLEAGKLLAAKFEELRLAGIMENVEIQEALQAYYREELERTAVEEEELVEVERGPEGSSRSKPKVTIAVTGGEIPKGPVVRRSTGKGTSLNIQNRQASMMGAMTTLGGDEDDLEESADGASPPNGSPVQQN